MSSPLTKHKTLILSLLLIALVIAGVFGAGSGVFADHGQPPHPPIAPPTTGNATPPTELTATYGVILSVLELVRGLLVRILSVTAFLLAIVFGYNLVLLPTYEPVVQAGWIVLRDLVNGLFILIVLWIALTIILGIEQYGGKKLLAKVLAVAVLINFSLAIVTAIIALSNQFALVFYDKIGLDKNSDLAGVILNYTKVQTITQDLNQIAQQNLLLSADQSTNETQNTTWCGDSIRALSKTLRPQEIGAVNLGLSLGKAAGGCTATGTNKLLRAGIGAIGSWLFSDVPKAGRANALDAAFGVIIILIITSAFVYATVALFIRILALMLISIFAPVASLALILPIPSAKNAWNQWSHALIKWSLFAPIFYFLMYLTLLMGQKMHDALKEITPPGTTSILGDYRRIFTLIIIVMMLHFTAKFAKDTSGKAGTIVMDTLKKGAGLAVGVTAGVATGGTLMATRGLLREASKEGGVLHRAAGTRIGHALGAGRLMRKGVRLREERKQQIAEREKKYEHLSTDQLRSDTRAGNLLYTQENAARISALAKRKGGLDGIPEIELAIMKEILTRFQMTSDIAKINPKFADKTTIGEAGRTEIAKQGYGAPGVTSEEAKAVQYAGEHLSGQDIDQKLDANALDGDDDKSKALRAGIVRNTNLTQRRIEDLVQKNYSAAQKVVADMTQFISQLDAQITTIDQQITTAQQQGNATEVTRLQAQRAGLEGQRTPKQAILNNLRTTPGGRALGLAAPELQLTGSRVVAGDASLTVDVRSRIRGGSGRYTFAANVPHFQIDPTGILTTDPANRPGPGRYPITVQVTDATDPNNPQDITINAVIR